MSAVLPHLVAKVDADFMQGDLKSARAAQETLNKWYVPSMAPLPLLSLCIPIIALRQHTAALHHSTAAYLTCLVHCTAQDAPAASGSATIELCLLRVSVRDQLGIMDVGAGKAAMAKVVPEFPPTVR